MFMLDSFWHSGNDSNRRPSWNASSNRLKECWCVVEWHNQWPLKKIEECFHLLSRSFMVVSAKTEATSLVSKPFHPFCMSNWVVKSMCVSVCMCLLAHWYSINQTSMHSFADKHESCSSKKKAVSQYCSWTLINKYEIICLHKCVFWIAFTHLHRLTAHRQVSRAWMSWSSLIRLLLLLFCFCFLF